MRTALLDLDGTITDPAPGMVGAYLHALGRLGLPAPPPSSLTWAIGPSLRTVFPKLLGPGADIEQAVRLYREYYGTGGLFEAALYEGMREAIAAIRAQVDRLYVCTAKPTHFAKPIVAHFGLDGLFDGVHGAELDGRFDDKGELIAQMVETLGLVPASTVMVGDRASDGIAAARNGVAAVAVAWGYGPAEEMTHPSFAAVCRAPGELPGTVAELLEAGGVAAALNGSTVAPP